MPRVVRHGRGVAPHDAGQRFDLHLIGNHADLVIHGDGVAIEQLELFARLAPAHIQTAVNLVQVENMGRATEFEHHVVGDVHQRSDAALTTACQTFHHPLRCRGLGIDVAQHAPGEAAAQIGGADFDRHAVLIAHGHFRERRRQQRSAGECGHFSRHTVDA